MLCDCVHVQELVFSSSSIPLSLSESSTHQHCLFLLFKIGAEQKMCALVIYLFVGSKFNESSVSLFVFLIIVCRILTYCFKLRQCVRLGMENILAQNNHCCVAIVLNWERTLYIVAVHQLPTFFVKLH